jgi:hypothetical protein
MERMEKVRGDGCKDMLGVKRRMNKRPWKGGGWEIGVGDACYATESSKVFRMSCWIPVISPK